MARLKIKSSWFEKLKPDFKALIIDRVESWDELNREFKQKLDLQTDDDLGGWLSIKKKLKDQFTDLSDDDLFFIEGREDELFSRLQKKVGNNTRELKGLIDKL